MDPRVNSFLGLLAILLIAVLFSNNRKSISPRVIIGGITLQFAFAIFVLKLEFGRNLLIHLKDLVVLIVEQSDHGAKFVFGPNFQDHFFAFKVLPTLILVSSLFYLLIYWGIIQRIVSVLAWIMSKTMRISGVESLVAAITPLVGQMESPLVIRPYLLSMTKSEINVMMTAGMGTIAGSVLAAYIGLGISATHLISASLMAAPAAVLLAKILYPETEQPTTLGSKISLIKADDTNSIEAICNGAAEGLKLALNVAAMLLTFISLIALLNVALAHLGSFDGKPLSFELIVGYLFRPMAFIIGIPWSECAVAGQLLGEKIVLNEFIAYMHLSELLKGDSMSERTIMLVTYALCGFANFSSVGMQIGGYGALAPSRKKDYAQLGMRALLGGILTGLMTACVAGMLI
jgi:CNT family concentrative nucleoside transporter